MKIRKNLVKLIAGSMTALTIMAFASPLTVYASNKNTAAYILAAECSASSTSTLMKFRTPKK